MNAGELQGQYFACFKKMPHISFTVIITYLACYTIINGTKILFPLFVIDINNTPACKQHGISAIAGWHYAVKHVYTIADAFQQIPGCTYSHQDRKSVV